MKRTILGILALVVVAAVALVGGGLSVSTANAARDLGPRTCVESKDGTFCLCKENAAVCAGERAVRTCAPRRTGGACCVSPAGFCYCTNDDTCTDAADRPVDRCSP